MESLYATDCAYPETSSNYAYASSPLFSPPLDSSLTSSPSEDASLATQGDSSMAEFPLASSDKDWDSLSDIFITDALNSLPPSSIIDLNQDLDFGTQEDTPNDPRCCQSETTPSSPFSGALSAESTYPNNSSWIEEIAVPANDEDLLQPVEPPPAVKHVTRARGRGRKVVSTAAPKKPTAGLDEHKKQRRRSQIALGVQRHREKKRSQVVSLQTEMSRLTSQLATLRAERRAHLANNDELMGYEEEAMTQRRKRKQAEQHNQLLKEALFQQTTFLGGMRAMMGGSNLLLSKTLEFHDWVHSYTALSATDALVRRKEYVAHFPRSKMELARNIVIQNTEEDTLRLLATGGTTTANIRIVHDGTRHAHEMHAESAAAMTRDLFGRRSSRQDPYTSFVDDAGDGRVIKEFSSVFFFPETEHCTPRSLMNILARSLKTIGVYYTGVSYEARASEEVHLEEDNGLTHSDVYYSDLVASMEPVIEEVDEADTAGNIDVEARVLTRVQCGQDEGILLWDYADEDTLHPIPVDSPDRKAIRRNVCGAMTRIVRWRSPRRTWSGGSEASDAEEIRRAITRRIGLQATESERLRDRCLGYIYNDIVRRLEMLQVS
ncbi:unnamed protein product [Hyaloperonospora brassicae]|uniref:BZIP domain-containing protein n=1 Tax=Hyaloperonospora brassicae TaxID=162125 RepID=A0AAV0TA77_HYABA|nr:unnamed protein product [Hyaloperonospora brassicae]